MVKTVPHDFIGPIRPGTIREPAKFVGPVQPRTDVEKFRRTGRTGRSGGGGSSSRTVAGPTRIDLQAEQARQESARQGVIKETARKEAARQESKKNILKQRSVTQKLEIAKRIFNERKRNILIISNNRIDASKKRDKELKERLSFQSDNKLVFKDPSEFGSAINKETGATSFTSAIPIERKNDKLLVRDFNFKFDEGGNIVSMKKTGSALLNESHFISRDRLRRDRLIERRIENINRVNSKTNKIESMIIKSQFIKEQIKDTRNIGISSILSGVKNIKRNSVFKGILD